MEMLFVSCVCRFSLPLVPVAVDICNGNLTEQRGMCRALPRENTQKIIAGQYIPKELPPPASASHKKLINDQLCA